MTSNTRFRSVHLRASNRKVVARKGALLLTFIGFNACSGQEQMSSDEPESEDEHTTWEPVSSATNSSANGTETTKESMVQDAAVEQPKHPVTSIKSDAMAPESSEEPGDAGAWVSPEVNEACSADRLSSISPANAGFTDTIYLRTNEEVWNLAALGCASLPATLFISGDDVTSLAGLENLERVEGSLVFEALGSLVDLSGLDGLKRIDGDLAIRSAAKLESLTGLSQLEYLGGTFELESTDIRSLAVLEDVQFGNGDLILNSNGLESLQGLESLTHRENVLITGSRNLQTLSGLNNLAHVASNLEITVNKTLTSLVGLNALRTVGGALTIEWNDSLESLDGLGALTVVREGSIASNQRLTSTAALSGVTTVHNLSIADNASLSEITLSATRTIDGMLTMEVNGGSASDALEVHCPALISAGAPGDVATGISVALNENLAVVAMPALDWARSIDVHENEGSFSAEMPALRGAEMIAFWKNPGLWTIHSLPALTELGESITIHTNPTLPSCELDEILFRLGECADCQSNPCNPH